MVQLLALPQDNLQVALWELNKTSGDGRGFFGWPSFRRCHPKLVMIFSEHCKVPTALHVVGVKHCGACWPSSSQGLCLSQPSRAAASRYARDLCLNSATKERGRLTVFPANKHCEPFCFGQGFCEVVLRSTPARFCESGKPLA